jgi:hypothetical protein
MEMASGTNMRTPRKNWPVPEPVEVEAVIGGASSAETAAYR